MTFKEYYENLEYIAKMIHSNNEAIQDFDTWHNMRHMKVSEVFSSLVKFESNQSYYEESCIYYQEFKDSIDYLESKDFIFLWDMEINTFNINDIIKECIKSDFKEVIKELLND